MSVYVIMIILSVVLILSFCYNYLLEKFQISTVLLLIITGVILKCLANACHLSTTMPEQFLSLFGTLGLITIVLEAVLDLKITKNNHKLVGVALLCALITVMATGYFTAIIFKLIYPLSWRQALIYAVPLSIISSAIVIPSIAKFTPKVKEFLTFESIFSDIIGILIFNYLIIVQITDLSAVVIYLSTLLVMIAISFAISIPLAIIMNHSKRNHQNIFVLAVLILIYSIAKYLELSSLLLILIFGLTLNNVKAFFAKSRLSKLFNNNLFQHEINSMQELTGELAFIIRTFFFVTFGYSLNFAILLDLHVIGIGTLVLAAIYLVRYLTFRFFSKENLITKTALAPRGLITILLFYQIPATAQYLKFNQGVVFFVVIVSSLVMSGELIRGRREHSVI